MREDQPAGRSTPVHTHLQVGRVRLVAAQCLLRVAQLRLQRGHLGLQRFEPWLHAGTVGAGGPTSQTHSKESLVKLPAALKP